MFGVIVNLSQDETVTLDRFVVELVLFMIGSKKHTLVVVVVDVQTTDSSELAVHTGNYSK
jgi:hypothetical protein